MNELQELARQSELFRELSPAALAQLTASAHRATVQPGEVLFHQNDEARSFFLLHAGRVRLVQHSAAGKDVTMATFVPGEVIGLVVALSGEPYPGTAEVLEIADVIR